MSNPVGRPPVDWDAVLPKLEEVFALGGSDLEACFYAGISKTALYNYQKDNPDFVERKEQLKERPILLARQTVVKAIKDDPLTARWFLERKMKAEFANRTELTGAEGKPLIVVGEIADKHNLEATPSPEQGRL